MMKRPVCTIVGFGPGLGAAFARRFSRAGYDLALLSRSGAKLLPEDVPDVTAISYACDAGDPTSVKATLARVTQELGPVEVLVYNADLALFGTIDEVSENAFELSWRTGVLGLYTAARLLGPEMSQRGSGTMIVAGATASLRGKPGTAVFAPTKAAQRILAQSLAKHLGPQGVHVAYLIIDGVIDTEDTRTNFAPGEPDEFFLQPDQIAETALFLAKQDRSAWTFELDLRPFGEIW